MKTIESQIVIRTLAFALIAVVLLLCLSPASAAVPPAGYEIHSQSRAEYLFNSQPFIAFSNQITTRVLPLYAVDLSPGGSVSAPAYSLQGYGGDTLYAPFALTNNANARDSLAVGHSMTAVPGFNPARVLLFHDGNGNGIFDSGEDDPGYLALEIGESVDVTAMFVLPITAGLDRCYREISARSASDDTAEDASVVRIDFLRSVPNKLFIGPDGNPKALPGGEESVNDFSIAAPDIRQTNVEFINEISSEGSGEDVIEIALDENNLLPDGVTVTFSDTAGAVLPRSPSRTDHFILGRIDPGRIRKVRVRVAGAGEPLYNAVGRSCAVPILVRSLVDSTRINYTFNILDLDGVSPPQPFIALKQTFKQQVASTGDVVTLIVTVKNISDSVAVDSVDVLEMVQPSLEFMSSPDFVYQGDRLVWRAGTLAKDEEKSTHIKFMCNGRLSRGKVKAVGEATGISEFGARAFAGPVVTVLGIENDIFSADGVVFGEVFVDADSNGVRGAGETGVPGAAVYLESGAYAITDSLGKFSLPQSYPGFRIVRLDESSLPPWIVRPAPGQSDGSGLARNTRLVHLLESGNASVSFPLQRRPVVEEVRYLTRSIVCQEKVSFTRKNPVLFQTQTLSSSYFETAKAYLKGTVIDDLRPLVNFLATHPYWCVYLEGHTDSIPIHNADFADNYELSVARAKAVQRFLEAQGVAAHRVVARGYGESSPVAANRTIQGRAMNRRVEVSLVPPGVAAGDIFELEKIKTRMNSLAEFTDSVQATILWRVTTDSPDVLNTRFRIDIPAAISSARTSVRYDGKTVEKHGGDFVISGFKKSKGIDIEVVCPLAGRDTVLIEDIRAVFKIDSVPAALDAAHPVGKNRFSSIVLQPLQEGKSIRAAAMYDVLSWQTADSGTPVPERQQNRGTQLFGNHPGNSERDSLSCAIVEPVAGSVFSKRDRITVHTRAPLGGEIVLECNGEIIPPRNIGEKVIELRRRCEDYFWYGVRLSTGWNRIVLTATDVDGAIRGDTIQVALAGKPAVLECERRRLSIPADGRTMERLRFAVKDALGLPVVDGIAATVMEGDSLVGNLDERPDVRGLQVTSKDGYFSLVVSGSTTTGRKNITLRLDRLEASCPIAYVPPERSFFISGIVDSRLGLTNATGSGSSPGLEDFDDGLSADGVSRLFAQGTVYGGMNVTMRLDSKKRYEDPLLKTLNPEREYPMYGDASELHYAAPSRGGNYFAVEKGESFARYGDFRTPLTDGEFLSYKRAATGVNARLTRGDRTFKGFITESDYTTFKDELPGDGTSGYYYLTQSPIVEYSEKIVVETRDRYQPEKILSVRPLIQNRDYTLNYLDGAILFKEPVPVTDQRFNPVIIVVIYEVSGRDTGRNKRYLYGVTGDIVRGTANELRVSAVAREGEGEGYSLYGASGNTSVRGITLRGEIARSEDEIAGAGNAFKLESLVNRGRAEGSLYLRRVDGDFLNPSFTGSAHELASLKAGYESKIRLFDSLSFTSLGYKQRFYRTGERRENVDALLEYRAGGFTSVGGVRMAALERERTARHGLLGIVGAGYERRAAKFETRWEKNMDSESVDDYPDRIRTTSSVNFLERFRLVLNHEYLTASSRGATHQAQIGVESKLSSRGSAYTKYSMNRTASDERLGAVVGLKQSFVLSERMGATFAIENYHSLSGDHEEDYVALKTGLNCVERRSYLVESQYELRWQKRATKHLLRVNGSRELKPGLSMLFKEALSYYSNDGRDDAISFAGRTALAYRPDCSKLQSLLMVKSTYERFTPVNPDAVTWKLVCSTDLNYRPGRPYELRFKYAMKYVEDYSLHESLDARSQLYLSQFIYRFGRRWDADVWGRMLHHSNGSIGCGTGIECGVMLFRCVRLAAGYSLNGFEEPDMAERDAWASGFGLRVQLLLSEWILNEAGL